MLTNDEKASLLNMFERGTLDDIFLAVGFVEGLKIKFVYEADIKDIVIALSINAIPVVRKELSKNTPYGNKLEPLVLEGLRKLEKTMTSLVDKLLKQKNIKLYDLVDCIKNKLINKYEYNSKY